MARAIIRFTALACLTIIVATMIGALSLYSEVVTFDVYSPSIAWSILGFMLVLWISYDLGATLCLLIFAVVAKFDTSISTAGVFWIWKKAVFLPQFIHNRVESLIIRIVGIERYAFDMVQQSQHNADVDRD